MHPILARAHEFKAQTIGWRRDPHTSRVRLGRCTGRSGAAELERLGYR
jgi:hypothetical protein